MSNKNSLSAKSARRQERAAKKNLKESLTSKKTDMEQTEDIKKEDAQKVGIIVELVKKSGDSTPVLFETDRNELYEALESIKLIEDINTEKEKWFQILALCLTEIIPIDESFFNAAILSIASFDSAFGHFKNNPNNPVGFAIMLHEGRNGYTFLPMTYQVWQELLSEYKTNMKLKATTLK